MPTDLTAQLRISDWFKDLPEEVLAELAQSVEHIRLNPEDVLFNKGDDGDALFLILSGWLKIVTESDDGTEMVLNHVGPGSVIGEVGMIDQEPRSAGGVAIEAVELLKLSRQAFLHGLEHQPLMAVHVIRDVTKRLRHATTYIENAIEWSQRIAAGDYSFATDQMDKVQSTIVDTSQPDEERTNRFLGNFYRMVEDIKAREDNLKKELSQLKVVIDQAQRRKDVMDLVGSDFFKKLKGDTGELKGGEDPGGE